jgi:prepilin-type N-terminal cleavage/methylation domain-containing protein
MRRDAGFTLVEVMVSMLIGTIGLLGTIAVQQAIIASSKNANDAAVAMRLATQKLEELSGRNTDTQTEDLTSTNGLSAVSTTNSASWSQIEYVDAEGGFLRDPANPTVPMVPPAAQLNRHRWHRQWRVFNRGPGMPYVISVIVTYNNDIGTPKTTRVDLERRKSW